MATAFSDQSSMLSSLNSLCLLDAEDMFLSELLQDKPESPPVVMTQTTSNPYVCGSCDEGSTVTSRCRDCSEVLCDNCVRAHLRVRLTKDHCIVRFSNTRQLSPPTCNVLVKPSASILNGNTYCDVHMAEMVHLYCETCCMSVCGKCTLREHRGHAFIYLQEAIDGSRAASIKLLSDARAGAAELKESQIETQRMIDAVNLKARTIGMEIRAMTRKLQDALEERECELLAKLERIRQMKGKLLIRQVEGLNTALSRLVCTAEQLSAALEVATSVELLHAKERAIADMKQLQAVRMFLQQPNEDDTIVFTPPEVSVYRAITSLGEVKSSGYGSAVGDGIARTARVRGSSFSLSHVEDACDPTAALLEGPSLLHMSSEPYSKKLNRNHPLVTMLRGQPIHANLFHMSGRDYQKVGHAVLAFGGEGDGEGRLCRPWGVCCDKEGNIIVADRSNNRVQMFRPDGSFLRMFGKRGAEPGQFDRPAGVAIDLLGRIVVADKDNHRIQLFTTEGKFMFMFGEKGCKNGQFNYPWDVDVNAEGRIVVSDTRNHRIQLFTGDGTFLKKYGFENTANMWKHFDSPRGVCFGYKGTVIVTDFNNHRLVVVEPNFCNARFLGTEGSGAKQFLRPQGVTVDADGRIIIADSRNNRVQIFEQDGGFLSQFGVAGKELGQLDRPSGICLTPDGKVVVVDFGNNRVQIF